jgi:hypothetical protein
MPPAAHVLHMYRTEALNPGAMYACNQSGELH